MKKESQQDQISYLVKLLIHKLSSLFHNREIKSFPSHIFTLIIFIPLGQAWGSCG